MEKNTKKVAWTIVIIIAIVAIGTVLSYYGVNIIPFGETVIDTIPSIDSLEFGTVIDSIQVDTTLIDTTGH